MYLKSSTMLVPMRTQRHTSLFWVKGSRGSAYTLAKCVCRRVNSHLFAWVSLDRTTDPLTTWLVQIKTSLASLIVFYSSSAFVLRTSTKGRSRGAWASQHRLERRPEVRDYAPAFSPNSTLSWGDLLEKEKERSWPTGLVCSGYPASSS